VTGVICCRQTMLSIWDYVARMNKNGSDGTATFTKTRVSHTGTIGVCALCACTPSLHFRTLPCSLYTGGTPHTHTRYPTNLDNHFSVELLLLTTATDIYFVEHTHTSHPNHLVTHVEHHRRRTGYLDCCRSASAH